MNTPTLNGQQVMDDFTKAILALGTGMGAIVFGYHKFNVDRSKTGTTMAQEAANVSQFKALQDAIHANALELAAVREDNALLRAQFYIMDRKVHVQQRTMTRMEMLLRQFSGLVQDHGIPVPAYMQKELLDLIESDTDKAKP